MLALFRILILALLLATSARAADTQGLMTILPGRVPYTSEIRGQLLITPSDQIKAKSLSVDVLCGGKQLTSKWRVQAGVRSIVPVSLVSFVDGANEVTCRLTGDGQTLATATVTLTKLPAKPNEVKIDNITNSMIVDGRPFLPVGFYCDADFGSLAEDESLNGFNMISPYWSQGSPRSPDDIARIREKMDRCASVGMRVNYHIERACMNLEGKALEDAIRPEIEAFCDHPALLSWYIADEPEYNSVSPERLQAAYRLVKQLDPYHPIGVCIAALSAMPKYVQSLDFIMSDSYPIPHMSVSHVGDSMDRAHRGTSNSKPVWVIPQVFGGGEFWYREPTAKEARVMTYLALIHGATGVQSFVRRPPIANPGSPVLWNECRNLAMEISQIAPAVLSAQAAPAVTSNLGQVQAKAFLDRGMLFVIAANTVNQPATMQLKIDGEFSGKASAIFERRELEVKSGVLEDMIDGMSTRIYRIAVGPMPKNDVEPSPDNVVANFSFEETVSAGSAANCYGSRNGYPYANAMLDPFVAKHGRQSVRMTVPEANQSIGLIPTLMKTPQTKTVEQIGKILTYWFAYTPGDQIKISIWAKAKDDGLTLRLSDGCLADFPKDFALTTDWQRYEVTATVTKKRNYTGLSFNLMGKGTAWFDLFEVVRVAPEPPPAVK